MERHQISFGIEEQNSIVTRESASLRSGLKSCLQNTVGRQKYYTI